MDTTAKRSFPWRLFTLIVVAATTLLILWSTSGAVAGSSSDQEYLTEDNNCVEGCDTSEHICCLEVE